MTADVRARFLFGEDRRDTPRIDVVGDGQGRVCLFEMDGGKTKVGSWLEVDERALEVPRP